MYIVPNQPFGIGDVIFCQTLVNKIANGNPILWPVWPQFVDQLNRAYPHIRFVDYRTAGFDHNRKDHYEGVHAEYGAFVQLPLRWADHILKVPYNDCMRAKYDLYGLDFETWRECAMWQARPSEGRLMANTLPFLDSEDYTLVNRMFGSEMKHTVPIPKFPNELTMYPMYGYSMFDWAHNIEQASAIHTVNTSIIYLLEMLELKAPEIHLYQRPIAGQTFDNIKYILKRHKYVFHE